jgi:hypothetical protein
MVIQFKKINLVEMQIHGHSTDLIAFKKVASKGATLWIPYFDSLLLIKRSKSYDKPKS